MVLMPNRGALPWVGHSRSIFQLHRNPTLEPKRLLQAYCLIRQPATCPNSRQIEEFSAFMHVLFILYQSRARATHAKLGLNLLRSAPEHGKFKRAP